MPSPPHGRSVPEPSRPGHAAHHNIIQGLQIFAGLTVLAALAEVLILVRIRIAVWPLAALLESVALLVGAFVGLTHTAFIKQLRQWSMASRIAGSIQRT